MTAPGVDPIGRWNCLELCLNIVLRLILYSPGSSWVSKRETIFRDPVQEGRALDGTRSAAINFIYLILSPAPINSESSNLNFYACHSIDRNPALQSIPGNNSSLQWIIRGKNSSFQILKSVEEAGVRVKSLKLSSAVPDIKYSKTLVCRLAEVDSDGAAIRGPH